MNRLEPNRELIRLLSTLVETYPEQRFSQLLENFKFISPGRENHKSEFYVESEEILDRVKKGLELN
jgi:hypothetical protein